jgi:hypothetical protein
MTPDDAREVLSGWLCREYEDLDPRYDVTPDIIEAVARIDAWHDAEFARLNIIDDAALIEAQAAADLLPRRRYRLTRDVSMRGGMITHRTPVDCWLPPVGGALSLGEYPRFVKHGVIVSATYAGPNASHYGCKCLTDAVVEVTEEWANDSRPYSAITLTPLEAA